LLKYIDSYGIKKKHVIPETCSEFGHFPEANPFFTYGFFVQGTSRLDQPILRYKNYRTGPVWPNPMENLGSEGYPAW
jgi:hypothetical protein